VTSLLNRPGTTRPSLYQLPGMSEDRGHHARPAKLLAMIALSVVGGLLLAVMMLPVVGGIGVTAKASADFFNDLPSVLVQPPLPERSVILDRNGNRIATLHGTEDRITIPFSDIPVAMRHAIVAIEDRRFYEHHGLDYRGIVRAALTNQENGDVTQGGSTLTQQYVKNVLIEAATTPAELKEARDRTVQRKIREARYALALEHNLSKDQILANYLNIANFGDGAYGVEAAAQHYFGIHAKQLNVVQSALLAGIVNSPTAYDPKLHPKAALDRRNLVLDQMVLSKYITPAQLKYAKALPLGLTKNYVKVSDGCELAGNAAYFCAYVRDTLLNDPTFGVTRDARERRLFEGGLTIKTSLDPAMQADAQNAVDTLIPAGGRIATADVVMKPGTGDVLAMAVNRRYADTTDHLPVYGKVNGKVVQSADQYDTKFNFATQGSYQAGSTFKMFTLAAALEKGLSTSTSFASPGCIFVTNFGDNPPGAPAGCQSDTPGVTAPYGFGFVNSDPAEAGIYNMAAGTADSVNTYFVQLEKKVGLEPVRDMAQRLGVRSPTLNGPNALVGSLTLGSREVSPLDMATAYATIAAHGLRCYPKPVLTMTGSNGKAVKYVGAGACKQVLSPGIADTVTSLLEGVIVSGTGANHGQIGRPAAGKTGTTDNHFDAWFVGYIPQLVTAVWVGDSRSPSLYPMEYSSTTPDGTIIGGYQQGSVFGGDVPTKVWAATMRAASNNLPWESFPPPDQQVIIGIQSPVPNVAGMGVASASGVLSSAGFTPVTGGTTPSSYAPGTVVFTTPGGGSTASSGSSVAMFVSSGPAPPPVTKAPTKKPTGKGTKKPVVKPTTKTGATTATKP
jgi:membrane peptidoglycan carboxypeptidase